MPRITERLSEYIVQQIYIYVYGRHLITVLSRCKTVNFLQSSGIDIIYVARKGKMWAYDFFSSKYELFSATAIAQLQSI